MMHPGFVLFLTTVIVPLVRGTARRVVLAAGTVAALISWESLDFTSGWRLKGSNERHALQLGSQVIGLGAAEARRKPHQKGSEKEFVI